MGFTVVLPSVVGVRGRGGGEPGPVLARRPVGEAVPGELRVVAAQGGDVDVEADGGEVVEHGGQVLRPGPHVGQRHLLVGDGAADGGGQDLGHLGGGALVGGDVDA